MAILLNPKNNKIIAKSFTLDDLVAADERYDGFCIACGAERECCEPDARKYHCDECDLDHVYGAGELIIMGRVRAH